MKNSGKNRIKIIATAIFAAFALLSAAGVTYAKYYTEGKFDAVFDAKSFYFESDLLKHPDTAGKYPSYKLQKGKYSVSFGLNNYADTLRVSEVDINYTVTVTKKGESTPIIPEIYGTVLISEKSDLITVTVTDPGTYLIEAKATSPYLDTLKAEITVTAANTEIEHKVNDEVGSPTLYLVVTTNAYSGSVDIEWPTGVYPDKTDSLLKSASGTKHTVTFASSSEYSFLFFKSDISKKYDKDDFTVTAPTP